METEKISLNSSCHVPLSTCEQLGVCSVYGSGSPFAAPNAVVQKAAASSEPLNGEFSCVAVPGRNPHTFKETAKMAEVLQCVFFGVRKPLDHFGKEKH